MIGYTQRNHSSILITFRYSRLWEFRWFQSCFFFHWTTTDPRKPTHIYTKFKWSVYTQRNHSSIMIYRSVITPWSVDTSISPSRWWSVCFREYNLILTKFKWPLASTRCLEFVFGLWAQDDGCKIGSVCEIHLHALPWTGFRLSLRSIYSVSSHSWPALKSAIFFD